MPQCWLAQMTRKPPSCRRPPPIVMRVVALFLCLVCAHEAAAFSVIAGLHSIGQNMHACTSRIDRIGTVRVRRHNVLGLKSQLGSGGPPMDNEPLDLSEETVKLALLETKEVICR